MIPIIFIHYGNTPYLRSTLKSSQISNPDKKKILIGDKSNKQVAQENGWEHFEFVDLKSEKRNNLIQIFIECKAGIIQLELEEIGSELDLIGSLL